MIYHLYVSYFLWVYGIMGLWGYGMMGLWDDAIKGLFLFTGHCIFNIFFNLSPYCIFFYVFGSLRCSILK